MLIETQNKELICDNLTRSADGELCLAGQPLSALAREYGTPLYLYDEAKIREKCRTYKKAVADAFGEKGRVMYASKAASFKRLYEIMREEEMSIDVVSVGEIYTAALADFPLESAMFHSNNKTDEDIAYAMDLGVGCFVVDNVEELVSIEVLAEEREIVQPILLRITPGIDPHTYAQVATGKVDSKFGSAIETGQALDITRAALTLPHINLRGFHCHVGSQIFDPEVYLKTSKVMLDFVKEVSDRLGFVASEVDLGGGLGVRYIADQPILDIYSTIREVGSFITSYCDELGIEMPMISFEPGRSIVADAGLTLYTVGTVKRIPGYKSYVSVDGGMTDNPRYALYGSPYTVIPVSRPVDEDSSPVSVVGRCCESGDILQENVPMPNGIKRGELLACLTTGAYHYSMASNYNRIPRPPIVMLRDGESYLAVMRETPEHVAVLDI